MKKVVIKNERGEQSEFSEFDFEFVFLTAELKTSVNFWVINMKGKFWQETLDSVGFCVFFFFFFQLKEHLRLF